MQFIGTGPPSLTIHGCSAALFNVILWVGSVYNRIARGDNKLASSDISWLVEILANSFKIGGRKLGTSQYFDSSLSKVD
jgi:hypothetical protein